MKFKKCEIVCDGKTVATIKKSEKGVSIECTKEGEGLCKVITCGCCEE